MNGLSNPEYIYHDHFRLSEQTLLPLRKEDVRSRGYDIYPTHEITSDINIGYNSLAKELIGTGKNIVIDGYSGVLWGQMHNQLTEAFAAFGIKANWIDVNIALRSEQEILQLTSNFSGGDDPLFGHIYDGELIDFFDQERLNALQPEVNTLNIIYGTGAALCKWEDTALVYIDVPKNEIQFRSRAGVVHNLGTPGITNPREQYKRFYFIDWVVLNRHKFSLLNTIHALIDEQRIYEITWIDQQALTDALNSLGQNVFRARPWFEPGVWGGQWMKEHIAGLNQSVSNYAWSFELIAPENGIILSHNNVLLEISFDLLMCYAKRQMLGKAAKRFGTQFPIRFDFLDTIRGGNLSVQCHPSVAYTKENFGEDFTQDETYYILESTADAQVYLGFQEDIDPADFKQVLENSIQTTTPVDIPKYIQTFPSKKHDLFLIPNGTVHCSGESNLVLEISATPYIYTFKMYDWLRPDLNGKPRPLNIDRAFENLNFNRKGDEVTNTLISRQTIVDGGSDWQLIKLSTHPEHFYAIERVEFSSAVDLKTNNQCHILSLVEGESIIVKTGNRSEIIHYAETFIVPAAVGEYTLINQGSAVAKVVRAFVKDECC